MATYFRSAFDYLKNHIFSGNSNTVGPGAGASSSTSNGQLGSGFGQGQMPTSIPIIDLEPNHQTQNSTRFLNGGPPQHTTDCLAGAGERFRVFRSKNWFNRSPSIIPRPRPTEVYTRNHNNNNNLNSIPSPSTTIFGLKSRKRKWEPSPSTTFNMDSSNNMESYRRMVNAISNSDDAIISASFYRNHPSTHARVSSLLNGIAPASVDQSIAETKRQRTTNVPATLQRVREGHRDVVSMFNNWGHSNQSTRHTSSPFTSKTIQTQVSAQRVKYTPNQHQEQTTVPSINSQRQLQIISSGSRTREIPIYSAGFKLNRHSTKSTLVTSPEVITIDDAVEELESETQDNDVTEVVGPTWALTPLPKVPHTPAPTKDTDIQILKEIKSPQSSTSRNTLELEQRSSKYHKKAWLTESSSSYRDSQLCKRNEIELERKKLELLRSEKNVTVTKDLEERIRRNLKITGVIELEEDEKPKVTPMPPLTDEMMQFVLAKMRGPSNEVLRTPTVTLTKNDLKTLAPCQWLNDMVINTYMDLIVARAKTDQGKFPIVHAFTTFFYPKYLNEGHSNILKRWTRKVDLFSVDIILFPIHLGVHWALAIADVKSKSIKYYDSLLGKQQRCLDGLLNYLCSEHKEKKGTALDRTQWTLELVRDIPTQENGSDCGVFTCQFAEYLSRRAPISFGQTHMPYFRDRMKWELLNQKLLI